MNIADRNQAKQPETAGSPGTEKRKGPLADVVIVDFSHVLSGPYATMTLADLGATVIKIEKPDRGDQTRGVPPYCDGMSYYFAALNRNKFSVSLDLKAPAGKSLIMELLLKADVLIHNFRPGVMDSLGLGYELLAGMNPRLIYCEISGFGQYGPLRDRPAYDNVAQAMVGFMALTGEPEGPPLRAGFAAGDLVAGLYAIQSVLTALYDRERTGQGQHIDVAMFDTLFNLLSYYVPYSEMTGHAPARSGAIHPTIVPMGSFKTTDGYIVVAAFNQSFWRNLCGALDKAEWLDDPRFKNMTGRARNRELLLGELQTIFRTKSKAEWGAILKRHDVPYGDVAELPSLLEDPNVAARALLEPVGIGTLRAPIRPVKYSAFSETVRKVPPRLGADTRHVLAEILGKKPEEIEALVDGVAVGPAHAKTA